MGDDATQAALREMSRAIGGLESSVKTLAATVQQQDVASSQGRRDIHQKFDALTERVSGISSKLDTAIADIVEIKPSVEAFDKAREQAKGAQKLGKVIWGLLFAAGGGLGWMLANWITITPKPPPH